MDFKNLRTEEGYHTSALTVAESLLDQHSDYSLAWTRLGAANRELGNLRHEQGDYQGALNYSRAAFAANSKLERLYLSPQATMSSTMPQISFSIS